MSDRPAVHVLAIIDLHFIQKFYTMKIWSHSVTVGYIPELICTQSTYLRVITHHTSNIILIHAMWGIKTANYIAEYKVVYTGLQ